MGICYTYFLYDDCYWSNGSEHRAKVKEGIKKEWPYAEIKAEWPEYLVVDLDKTSPFGDSVQKLRSFCDSAYYYGDSSEWDIQKVDFKLLPKEQVIIENDNRLKDTREQAYKDWTTRYHNQEISSNNELTHN